MIVDRQRKYHHLTKVVCLAWDISSKFGLDRPLTDSRSFSIRVVFERDSALKLFLRHISAKPFAPRIESLAENLLSPENHGGTFICHDYDTPRSTCHFTLFNAFRHYTVNTGKSETPVERRFWKSLCASKPKQAPERCVIVYAHYMKGK